MEELIWQLNGGRDLRILLVEDSEDDEILIREQLKDAEVPFSYQRVAKKDDYIHALENFQPDIILSDYNLPGFDGPEALELKKFYNLEVIPFLFVTGFLGEEKAVEAIKNGASDFVLKENLKRLPMTILRALKESQERRKRIKLEVSSRRNEAKYRHLIEQAADGIFIGDEQFRFIEVNSKACEMLGYSKEELLQLSVKDITPPGLPAPDLKELKAGEVRRYESTRRRKDGSLFPVELSVTYTTFGFYQAIMRDISRRKKAEKALNEAVLRLDFYMANSPLAMVELNMKGIIKKWTYQAERMFGWNEEEALGKHPLELKIIDREDVTKAREMVAAILKAQKNHFTYTSHGFTKEGKKVYCEWYNSLLTNEKGELESMLTLVNDVTVKKVTEEARWEGQLEERKRVAREIHEGIGQLLVATKFKLASLDFTHDAEEKLNEMEVLLEKGIEEVRRVAFNMAPRSVEQIGVETAVRQLAEQVQRLTGIEISFRYVGQSRRADNGTLSTVYRLVQECLNNIILHSHASRVQIHLGQHEKEIKLKVEDNGNGLEANGFSFGPESAIGQVRQRVEQLGGRFQFNSIPRAGTRIQVNIPLS